MRKAEILNLKREENLDLKHGAHGFILLKDTKNGERREIPINKTLREALAVLYHGWMYRMCSMILLLGSPIRTLNGRSRMLVGVQGLRIFTSMISATPLQAISLWKDKTLQL